MNTDALYEMGGRYIFSSLPIENAHENNLIFEKSFEHPESAWKVYLYRVMLQNTS